MLRLQYRNLGRIDHTGGPAATNLGGWTGFGERWNHRLTLSAPVEVKTPVPYSRVHPATPWSYQARMMAFTELAVGDSVSPNSSEVRFYDATAAQQRSKWDTCRFALI